MNHTTTTFLCIVVAFLMMCPMLRAQSLEEENEKQFSKMERYSFKGKVVLNKAIIIDEML